MDDMALAVIAVVTGVRPPRLTTDNATRGLICDTFAFQTVCDISVVVARIKKLYSC